MEALILPVALFGFMYVFLILPQRRKQKAHQNLISSVGEGDDVLTSGGIYGRVTDVEDDDLFLEVAPDIELRVQRSSIASRVSDGEETEQDTVVDDEDDGEDDDDDS